MMRLMRNRHGVSSRRRMGIIPRRRRGSLTIMQHASVWRLGIRMRMRWILVSCLAFLALLVGGTN
jgi:hypothetical protein